MGATPTKPLPVHIRWMIRRDLEQVVAIENLSFPDPWTADDFMKVLLQRNRIGMVAEVADSIYGRRDAIAGYMLYELNDNCLRLINLAVHPDFRRRCVGTAMVRKLVSKLSPQRRSKLIVEAADYNLLSHVFLRACGFVATEIVPGLFVDDLDGTETLAYKFEWRVHEANPLVLIAE